MEIVNAIADPCSVSSGTPVGLVDLGVVKTITVTAPRIDVTITPTFPGCHYTGVFVNEIKKRLLELPWCETVVFDVDISTLWEESSASPKAQRLLRLRRGEPAPRPERPTRGH